MEYCRVKIHTPARGCVYQKDFDAQHIFGPLVRTFASEFVRQKAVQDGEQYNAVITPRYETTMQQAPVVRVNKATTQETFSSWLHLAVNGSARADQPITFFTLELRFRESGIIYAQDLQILTVDYFWTNVQTALVRMHVLQEGELYTPQLIFRSDDQANFEREIVNMQAPGEDPLIELVEIEESAPPELPVKTPGDFTVLRVQDVPLVSAVELAAPDDAHQDTVRVYIKQAAFEALQAIARQDVQIEQGGVLVGQVYRNAESGGYLVEIADHIFAEGATANITELHYDFEAWQKLRARLKDEHPGKQMVGWYHTHLVKIALSADDLDQTTELFFSDHDRFMHRQFFADAWYVAMVLGPEGNAAFFRWFGDKISCNRQFYII